MNKLHNPKLGNIAQLCRAERATLSSGQGKGLEICTLQNGAFSIEVVLDKGMDLYAVSHKGVNLAYMSPNGLVNRRVDGEKYSFSRQFAGGFLFTGGPDSIGDRQGFPSHGFATGVAAQNVSCECNEKGVKIRGEMHYTELYKDHLVCTRTIAAEYNSNQFIITDELENCGFSSAGYAKLFHFNLGYPMIDEGTTIRAEQAFSQDKEFDLYEYDYDGKTNAVLQSRLPETMVDVVIRNEKIKKELTLSFDGKALPWLIRWKGEQPETYVAGIEPATCGFNGDFVLSYLEPGQCVTHTICVAIKEI